MIADDGGDTVELDDDVIWRRVMGHFGKSDRLSLT